MPPSAAAALARSGCLELPTLRNLAVCSRGTLAEGERRQGLSLCSIDGSEVPDLL